MKDVELPNDIASLKKLIIQLVDFIQPAIYVVKKQVAVIVKLLVSTA